mmetsp:Transcript_80186/g.235900  ORF Transcript_80186/g.235900 Transcript_80186/m.235900 type:complete len:406 (+) Transcript_80186:273-1490(+)
MSARESGACSRKSIPSTCSLRSRLLSGTARPTASSSAPTTIKFASTETFTKGTNGSSGLPTTASTTRTSSPDAMPAVRAGSARSRYRLRPNVGRSCISIPFWNTIRDENWDTDSMSPNRIASTIMTSEFSSPSLTMRSTGASGHNHPWKMSMDTTLEAPMSAESAVDMMAASVEQVMTVTRKYSKAPWAMSWSARPEKAVACCCAPGQAGSKAALVRPMTMPGGWARKGATSSEAMTTFRVLSSAAMYARWIMCGCSEAAIMLKKNQKMFAWSAWLGYVKKSGRTALRHPDGTHSEAADPVSQTGPEHTDGGMSGLDAFAETNSRVAHSGPAIDGRKPKSAPSTQGTTKNDAIMTTDCTASLRTTLFMPPNFSRISVSAAKATMLAHRGTACSVRPDITAAKDTV